MVGNKDLPKEKITSVVTKLKTGKFSLRYIAKKEMISLSSVHKISTRLKNNDDPTENRRMNCRKIRGFSPRVDRKIISIVNKDRFITTRGIKTLLEEENINMSTSTIRRRLGEARLKGKRPVKNPF